jgi:spore coat protein U-like protein
MNNLKCKLLSFTVALLSITGSHQVLAGTTSANAQATATLSSSCTISAQNLSFGALTLPLSSQTASSSMNVLCSKNHAYTVGLTYGGVYGGQNAGDYWVPTGSTGQAAIYTEYNSSGQAIGSLVSPNMPPNTTWNQSINSPVYTVNATYYGYGKMVGVMSGDTVGYFIQVPNQPGEVWNNGNYSYSGTGTGDNQTLPIVGTLVPGQSGSAYPTPDSYADTVTATVSF